MDIRLNWPIEAARANSAPSFQWNQAGSNLCLDFHGNPLTAKLVVFSDGNHHMALEACCQAFLQRHPEITDIFYATTPPKVILQSTLQGGVLMGNLHVNVMPHVFISPENIVDTVIENNLMLSHQAFARSCGNVLLVRKGNPKNINGIADLLRDDVQLTISNPITEAASYEVYKETLLNVAQEQELDVSAFAALIDKDSTQVVFGESIHHREVPQTIYSGAADVALVYYHLALRYTRIFPNDFEFVEIETKANVYTDYHIGLINGGGDWGKAFLDFMLSEDALKIYAEHGLQAV